MAFKSDREEAESNLLLEDWPASYFDKNAIISHSRSTETASRVHTDFWNNSCTSENV
jgi:hypothetical protein